MCRKSRPAYHSRMSNRPVTLTLRYREPYDFAAALEFLGRRSIPEVEAADGHGYRRVLPSGENFG